METEDMKALWQDLDQRLQRHSQRERELMQSVGTLRMRGNLRWVSWNSVGLLLAALLLLKASLPLLLRPYPGSLQLSAAALVLFAVGFAVCAFRQLQLTRAMDFCAPLAVMQQQLDALHRFMRGAVLLLVVPCWVLWVPLLIVFAASRGTDLYAQYPTFVRYGLIAGCIGLMGTLAVAPLARRSPKVSAGVRRICSGPYLNGAQRALDDLVQGQKDRYDTL